MVMDNGDLKKFRQKAGKKRGKAEWKMLLNASDIKKRGKAEWKMLLNASDIKKEEKQFEKIEGMK